MPDSPLPAGEEPPPVDDAQALAESDQTESDSDQTAADEDQAASEADQVASDEDQAASDRDLDDGGSLAVHEASSESRDQGTSQRLRSGHRRASGAAVRDSVANARDQAAEVRDRAAAEHDQVLEELDAELGADSSEPPAAENRSAASRERIAADRQRAASARHRAAVDRAQAAQDRRHAAKYRIEAQEERSALLEQVAVSETDPLTGARARAPGLRDLELEINRARRTLGALAVAYVDVCGLKAVNESQGHAAGDELLKNAVRAMRGHLRSYDTVIRVGGDEFVCVMAGATVEDGRQRFARIQADAVASGLSLRFGIAALEDGDGPSDLVERADLELLSISAPPSRAPAPIHLPLPRDVGAARILVTDDSPEMVALVNEALAERYACEFAGSLEEARGTLAARPFDLLLCDLQAGGRSVMRFARESVAVHRDTAVILLAPEDDPAIADRAFEFGAFGYVVRPLPGQLLIATMNALRRRDLEIAHRRLSQNREDRRQAILDRVPIAIFVKDAAGRYVVANAKADEIAGVEAGGLLGLTDDTFLPAVLAASMAASDESILDGAPASEREDTIESRGRTRTFKTIRFPLSDEAGTVVAVGGVATDITVEREAIRVRDRSIEELKISRQETVERLARAIDHRDSSTGRHVQRLSAITSLLGAKLGMDPERVDLLTHAAPMHDVGKIGTPDEILGKPGPLTAAERSAMELHTSNGYEILADSKSELLRLAAVIALTHHERYDGSGYPNGLVGEEIPLEGRITAVADVFDALLSDRVYRPAFSVPEAVSLLEAGRGTQFDPTVLAALLDNLDEVLLLPGSRQPEPPAAEAR